MATPDGISVLSPASMAGLPGKRAMVWVGPPFFARLPRPGLATPTLLPLTPSVRPPDPPVPIRLNWLVDARVPATSSATGSPPLMLTLRATIALSRVAVPAGTLSPPPVPLMTALSAMVELMRVAVPKLRIPPPP